VALIEDFSFSKVSFFLGDSRVLISWTQVSFHVEYTITQETELSEAWKFCNRNEMIGYLHKIVNVLYFFNVLFFPMCASLRHIRNYCDVQQKKGLFSFQALEGIH